MIDAIILDGRAFSSQPDRTDQREYIIEHLRLADAPAIMNDLDGKTRTEEQRAEDLFTQILLSGEAPYIHAGCLTEEGKVWSRAEADRNAARFAATIDSEDILVLNRLMVNFVIALFATAGKETVAESEALRHFRELEIGDQQFVN